MWKVGRIGWENWKAVSLVFDSGFGNLIRHIARHILYSMHVTPNFPFHTTQTLSIPNLSRASFASRNYHPYYGTDRHKFFILDIRSADFVQSEQRIRTGNCTTLPFPYESRKWIWLYFRRINLTRPPGSQQRPGI